MSLSHVSLSEVIWLAQAGMTLSFKLQGLAQKHKEDAKGLFRKIFCYRYYKKVEYVIAGIFGVSEGRLSIRKDLSIKTY
jgi:hypothetical protein